MMMMMMKKPTFLNNFQPVHSAQRFFITPMKPSKMVDPIPVVLHKAVVEVSKIGKLQERLVVVVMHEWQGKSTDRPKGG